MGGEKVVKAGTPVRADAEISIREKPPYVSRGGEKLAAGLDLWGIACEGKTWIDAGCSTGGFTDCLLRRGASLVYAIDVGENQLDWRLRADPRVRVMESTNVMAVRAEELDPVPDSAVADLSFRSLRQAAARILGLTTERRGIFLVKPQFEFAAPAPGLQGSRARAGCAGRYPHRSCCRAGGRGGGGGGRDRVPSPRQKGQQGVSLSPPARQSSGRGGQGCPAGEAATGMTRAKGVRRSAFPRLPGSAPFSLRSGFEPSSRSGTPSPRTPPA